LALILKDTILSKIEQGKGSGGEEQQQTLPAPATAPAAADAMEVTPDVLDSSGDCLFVSETQHDSVCSPLSKPYKVSKSWCVPIADSIQPEGYSTRALSMDAFNQDAVSGYANLDGILANSNPTLNRCAVPLDGNCLFYCGTLHMHKCGESQPFSYCQLRTSVCSMLLKLTDRNVTNKEDGWPKELDLYFQAERPLTQD
jgi:hypothetical protein